MDCIIYGANLRYFPRASKIAQKVGISIYAWIQTMIGLGDDKQWLYDNHPEAYVVTRSGIHSHEHGIYGVEHYKFLCPNQPIVRSYIKDIFEKVLNIPEIDGINLDYIRYIEQNLEKYDPNGDTCYCEYCVSDFYNKTGVKIKDIPDPSTNIAWNSYRVNVITSLVNEIANLTHLQGKLVSADVYPGPWQSTIQTKQKWQDWDLDIVFPMLYTEVFAREVEWIGEETSEGVSKLKENMRNTKIITGLQAEAMNNDDFREGVKNTLKNGAYGISVFRAETTNIEKFKIVMEEMQNK